ncbi:hypothetical protein [Taklimakanibacter albus]|uniref:Uncharacterized protein n=1 Tax=Taklimakanibacter albus TaxID=2800327 RepID=A0ACC5R9F2_9HYPH|nr:hypothetical protein [Aestuariivirga sp. YIM B02566]MBK1869121.1 hypothetical protein [Aestuariivirga sp. YIM B02566]
MSSTHVRRAPLIALAAGFFILTMPLVSHAQFAMCGERAQIVEQLKVKYKETPQAVGIVSDNGVAELFVSEQGTWTMLMTLTSGKSCIIAAGHSWDAVPTLARGTGI